MVTMKRRNCSKQAISPFVTMFPTLFNYCSFIQREFSNNLRHVFKVVCWRYDVWWTGLSKTWCVNHTVMTITFWSLTTNQYVCWEHLTFVHWFSLFERWCWQIMCVYSGTETMKLRMITDNWNRRVTVTTDTFSSSDSHGKEKIDDGTITQVRQT